MFFEIFVGLVRGHVDQLELEHAAEGDEYGAGIVLIDPSLDLCDPFVLLLRVIIFGQIYEIHNGLRCQEQMLVERFDL